LLELSEWTIKLGLLFHRRVKPTRGSVTGSGNKLAC
jgi:hypothetical protein